MRLLAIPLVLLVILAMPATATELVMIEEPGCVWCTRWDADIATAYPLTPEGDAAPLRRIRLDEPLPGDLNFSTPVLVTPTFVLVEDGEEVARIEGYPGESFFWPLLGRMLEKLEDG